MNTEINCPILSNEKFSKEILLDVVASLEQLESIKATIFNRLNSGFQERVSRLCNIKARINRANQIISSFASVTDAITLKSKYHYPYQKHNYYIPTVVDKNATKIAQDPIPKLNKNVLNDKNNLGTKSSATKEKLALYDNYLSFATQFKDVVNDLDQIYKQEVNTIQSLDELEPILNNVTSNFAFGTKMKIEYAKKNQFNVQDLGRNTEILKEIQEEKKEEEKKKEIKKKKIEEEKKKREKEKIEFEKSKIEIKKLNEIIDNLKQQISNKNEKNKNENNIEKNLNINKEFNLNNKNLNEKEQRKKRILLQIKQKAIENLQKSKEFETLSTINKNLNNNNNNKLIHSYSSSNINSIDYLNILNDLQKECSNDLQNKMEKYLTFQIQQFQKKLIEDTQKKSKEMLSSYIKKFEETEKNRQNFIEEQMSRINTNRSFDSFSNDLNEIHNGIQCKHCGKMPIIGIRYKCSECGDDYNLCADCEEENYKNKKHEHNFIRIRNANNNNNVNKFNFETKESSSNNIFSESNKDDNKILSNNFNNKDIKLKLVNEAVRNYDKLNDSNIFSFLVVNDSPVRLNNCKLVYDEYKSDIHYYNDIQIPNLQPNEQSNIFLELNNINEYDSVKRITFKIYNNNIDTGNEIEFKFNIIESSLYKTVRDFRNEFNLSESEYTNERLKKLLIDNNMDKNKAFENLFN